MSTEDKKDIETIRKGSNFKLLRTRRVGRMYICDIGDHVTTRSVVESHITIVTHPSGAGVPAERVCGTISKRMICTTYLIMRLLMLNSKKSM